MPETVYLLLGSNLGDREQNLDAAIHRLEQIEGFEILAVSSVYASEPVGMVGENPPFLNQVVKGDFMYNAVELLDHTERIEREFGRADKGKRLARTLDIDILLFGRRQIRTDRLLIPHRELPNRPFALVPLLEIDPDLTHPATGKPLANCLSEKQRHTVAIVKEYVARNC
jgi:2-amino-4-hydroxy-6-hydroxymethyldihydropteridine diphosphokinase